MNILHRLVGVFFLFATLTLWLEIASLVAADNAQLVQLRNLHDSTDLIDDVSIDAKIESLLKAMTIDEKIGQMTQIDLGALKDKSHIQQYFIGSMLSGGDSDPPDNSPQTWAKTYDELQSWALKTRLKIPLLYGVDAVHGHNNVEGAVIFPHNIGLGAMRNAELVEKAARVTAQEVSGTGINWTFAPCIAVARNPRWGRTYESFGETPELAEEMGAAAVRGFQGKNLANPTAVVACASITWATAAPQTAKIKAIPNVTKQLCARSTCLVILPPSRPAQAQSWFPTAVGTERKCTATSICLPTC